MKQDASSGTVLIMVLILNAIIYLAISTLFLLIMTEIHLADFELRSTQAFYIAESAITEGSIRLRANHKNHQILNKLINVGGRQNALTTTFTPKPCGENGTSESWYTLFLQGLGVVTGPQAATRRKVEREITLKPFTLFAEKNINLQKWCYISGPDDTNGNIHGNTLVIIDKDVTVEGDVSSSIEVRIHPDLPLENLTGNTSQEELEIKFPDFSVVPYTPKYIYNGEEYQAQPLSYQSFPSEDGMTRLDIYYSGTPGSENPAGIYLLDEEIIDNLNGALAVFTTFDVQGTMIVRKPFTLKGRVRIDPVAGHFPAFISPTGNSVDMTLVDLMTVEALFPDLDIEDSALIPNENVIEGLIYSAGNIILTAYSDRADIHGSIFGHNITLNGDAVLNVTYAPSIMTNSPPGLQLVDYGEWREVIE